MFVLTNGLVIKLYVRSQFYPEANDDVGVEKYDDFHSDSELQL